MPGDKPILFFDGKCGLCDRAVTFLFARDGKHALRFAPLQGSTAARALKLGQSENFSTVILLENGVRYVKSDAILRSLRRLSPVWASLSLFFGLVPRAVRNAMYDFVAARRLNFFGAKDTCRLPTPAEKEFFLD